VKDNIAGSAVPRFGLQLPQPSTVGFLQQRSHHDQLQTADNKTFAPQPGNGTMTAKF
jgi:hypothetical protein